MLCCWRSVRAVAFQLGQHAQNWQIMNIKNVNEKYEGFQFILSLVLKRNLFQTRFKSHATSRGCDVCVFGFNTRSHCSILYTCMHIQSLYNNNAKKYIIIKSKRYACMHMCVYYILWCWQEVWRISVISAFTNR